MTAVSSLFMDSALRMSEATYALVATTLTAVELDVTVGCVIVFQIESYTYGCANGRCSI